MTGVEIYIFLMEIYKMVSFLFPPPSPHPAAPRIRPRTASDVWSPEKSTNQMKGLCQPLLGRRLRAFGGFCHGVTWAGGRSPEGVKSSGRCR